MQIHWLASYPKSGNTWVRFLLHHYLWGEVTDTATLRRRVPDVHTDDLAPAAGEGPLLVKTHWVLSPTMPMVERTAGAIYIVRHPKDVLLSLLDFYRLRDPDAPWKREELARLFISGGGDPSMAQRGYGTWVQHITTWLTQRRFPLLLVRYEDLKEDSARQLARMVEFLGKPVDDARVRQSAAACTFERMREVEAKEKEGGRASVFDGGKAEMARGMMFMSQGRMKRTLAEVSPALDREFDERFRVPVWLMGW